MQLAHLIEEMFPTLDGDFLDVVIFCVQIIVSNFVTWRVKEFYSKGPKDFDIMRKHNTRSLKGQRNAKVDELGFFLIFLSCSINISKPFYLASTWAYYKVFHPIQDSRSFHNFGKRALIRFMSNYLEDK